MQETVTVQFVNAKPGRHSSIKTTDGRYISVPTSHINLFRQNETYTIETELAGPNGQYTNFKNMVGAPPQQQYQPAPQPAPQPQHAAPRPDTKTEDMAVMGLLGRTFQGTGSLPDTFQLAALMRSVRTAWRDSYHDSGAGQQNDAPGPIFNPCAPGAADPFDMSQ